MTRKDSLKIKFGTKGKKYKSTATHLEAFWRMNNEKLIREFRAHDTEERTDYQIKKTVLNDIKAYMEVDKLTFRQSVKRELNTRAFKSQEEFYRDSIMESVNGDKDLSTRLREFSRDAKGRFAKTPEASYMGKVDIDDTVYSKYQFINTDTGRVMFVYEAQSPKSVNYKIMMSEVDYK